MTTNIERAAEVIYDHMIDADAWPTSLDGRDADDVARGAAQALASAGLLAPDLQEPARNMISPDGLVWYPTGPVGDVRATPGTVICFGMWQDRAFRIVTDPTKARELALALLAAANHAEQEQA